MKDFNLKPYKILIVGDIMLDRYLYGNISRISPEAPVPILEKINIENKPGGAANVALNIKSLGSTPILLSMIGDDEDGTKLINQLENNNISTKYIFREKNRITTVKTRIMSEGQHVLRIDEEDTSNITRENTDKLKNIFQYIIDFEKVDAVIFQDYDKGLLNDEFIQFLISKSKEKNIFISVDPKFDNFFSYIDTDLFKPNLKEVGAALNESIEPNLMNLDKVANKLKSKLNFKHIYITLGSKGIYYFDGNKSEIVPTKLQAVVDVSGAGDVVLSIATLSFLDKNNTPSEVAHISNVAGGIACGKVGVATVKKELLLEKINL